MKNIKIFLLSIISFLTFTQASHSSENSKIKFAAVGLDHSHIYGQTEGLVKAGAECKYVFDPDEKKVSDFKKKYPNAIVAKNYDEILNDSEIQIINCASVPADRFEVGKKAMLAGKDFMVDKPPFTTLEQLREARELVKKTGKKYIPVFGERFGNPSCEYAHKLIQEGKIGKVVQVLIIAPHRLNEKLRPQWFFQRNRYGGIITDIGAHQFDLFLAFANEKNAKVNFARVANVNNPNYPELQDFGEASLTGDNGTSCYLRVDWFTPDGLPMWGDGRTIVLGTEGYIELRNNIDISKDGFPKQSLYICTNKSKPEYIDCRKMPNTFYKKFLDDIKNRTENAITQEHAFTAAELALKAQSAAEQK